MQLENAIRPISVAGVLEFDTRKDRALREELRALTTGRRMRIGRV